ncbi:T9SS type A sorting domain-containing protein [Psychroserpens sp. SPM9]|uniref:T9SS type A sorting domain-containing protein n=1 Tax=Psychroserpens sp. SPM9 TaxID=2975598 RepID=UPI0021A6A75C|nr:T9SS type A sorting domain-containing protein [Psychroserpens sp. SPM9]MDG5491649.1 T9SS type A sorting domain-containing protein [Psychroserpens sp. SPM9]
MTSPKSLNHVFGIQAYCLILIVFTFFFTAPTLNSQTQLAFPTASGAGSYTTGGRGKPVYIVTNLNNSGPGSFRQALENTKTTDGGIITFEVSGTINLTSQIYFTNQDNITIAGQTAPEGGITIANYRLRFQNVNNLIMRYIRIRPGYSPYPSTEIDAFEIFNCSNYIIDHCSFSWGTDEAADSGNGSNYTWQRNLFAESNKTGMIMGGEANLSENLSFVNNMFYNCSHRFPNFQSDGRVDVINNVVWNWRTRMSVPLGGFEVNHINNYYMHYTSNPPADTDVRGMLWIPNTTHFPTIYTSGNYINSVLTDPEADNWFMWRFRFNPSGTPYSGAGSESPLTEDFRTFNPFTQLGNPFTILSAVDAFDDVRHNVGANARLLGNGNSVEEIDALDEIYLTNVQNDIVVQYTQDNVLNTTHRAQFLNSISTTPINVHPDSYDTDNDGMPDEWEMANFGHLNNNGQSDTDGNGYTDIEDFLNGVDFDAQGVEVSVTADNDTICVGEEVILTASGADSFVWEHNGATSPTITVSPSETTTYTVSGSNSDGNVTQDEITITVNPMPTADAGEDVETCFGTPVTLTASGGTSYEWSNGATTATITVNPSETTTFSVEVSQNDCVSTDEVVVIVNEIPEVDAGEDETIFVGESITLTATGADSYLWSTGETTQSITVSPILDTSYSVTGTTNTCENTDSVTVFLLDDSVNANAGADTEICTGDTITLTATGGTTYVWNTGETTASIDVSPTTTTTYTVTAFSISGTNFEDDSVTVTVNDIPTANAGNDTEICFGNSTTLTATGGTSYLWSTGETTASITVAPNETTTYSVEVFENNCSSSDEVLVNVLPLPATNAGADVTITDGESTTLTASGANTYLWSTGETTATITVTPNSTTTYTVTGFSGDCESEDIVTVSVESETITANAGEDMVICNGETTTLTASGGTTYLWNTGATTASISVSPNTTTTYTVTAFNSAQTVSDEDSVMVTVNELPSTNAGSDMTITEGESTTLTASGADTYLWSTGETTATITVSPTSTTTYSVTGFTNGCETSDEVTVSVETENVSANAGQDIAICNGETTTLTASGGTTYLWNTGETTASISVSPNTTTTYTVTAFNSAQTASDEDSVIVTVNELPSTNAGADMTITEGESTTLTASGADTYLWSTGETTATIAVSPTSTTSYSVTGFTNGCETSDEVTVSVEIENVSANAGQDIAICNGETTTLTASGGTTYLWNTGATTASISVSPNTTTTYTVTAFNSAQTASDEDSVTVTVNELPSTNAGADITITEGESTTLTALGADTYLWSTGETTASISVTPETTTIYSVTGFSNGCESTDEVVVTLEAFEFEASAGGDQNICQGYETTLTASEGDAYLWSTGETTQSITVNPSNTQTYTVTVFIGEHQDDADVTVSVNPNPNVIITNGSDVTILEGEFVTLSAAGANTYLWNNGATQPNIAVSPSVTTSYEVTGYINNCEDTASLMVNVVEIVEADAGEDLTICNDETITLTANGGDEYLWNTGETTQSIEVSPDEDTEYSVLVYNALSSDEDTVVVYVEQCNIVENPGTNDAFDFVVYQDPITDILKIKIDGLQSISASGFTIYDLSGKVLHTENFDQAALQNQSEMTKELDTSTYSRGIYIIRLIYDGTSLIKKIPIQ